MPQTDELATTVNDVCKRYTNNKDHYLLESTIELNDIVDEIFDDFDQDYTDGYFNRELTIDEQSQILDAVCVLYSVKNMTKADLKESLFNEYID